MHLGQTASYLAFVFNRPEPTMQMLARLLRDDQGQWVKKGGRGRSAHHLDSRELASFIIAMMACPDSPAQALDRLPHFAALQLDTDDGRKVTFQDALALLLTRLSRDPWKDAWERQWSVVISIDLSAAKISETSIFEDASEVIEHTFMPHLEHGGHDRPYWGGLSVIVQVGVGTLFRIARVVLANEADPVDEIIAALVGEV